jgi:hypothetical protein
LESVKSANLGILESVPHSLVTQLQLTINTRYQLASEAIDERWIGEHSIGHGPNSKRGTIC